MRSKRCDNAKSKSIYSISHRLLLNVESSKNKKKIKKNCYVINYSNVSYIMFNVSRFFDYSNTINRLRVDFNKLVNFYS